MGLDITSYRKLTPAPEVKLDKEGYPEDWETYHLIHEGTIEYTNKSFPGRTEGLTPGVYRAAEQDGFRAGSYSGYNRWREHLSHMAYWTPAEKVWATKKEGPFYELINFSDCEGYIGPVVSAKLARDFVTHEHRAVEYAANLDPIDRTWFLDRYFDWKRAFEMAMDGGCVVFG